MPNLEQYALLLAKQCIDAWAGECWYELNEEWGTDFTDGELHQIIRLAKSVEVTLPESGFLD